MRNICRCKLGEFFRILSYSSDIELFFPVNYDQTLSVHQQLSCEGEILERVTAAINSSSTGKAAGIDVILIELTGSSIVYI